MKNKLSKPTRSKFNILRQVCNFIPAPTVSKIARETGVEGQARTFQPRSHVVALRAAQVTHSIGLNNVCESLQLHSGPLWTIRRAAPPSRNGFFQRQSGKLAENRQVDGQEREMTFLTNNPQWRPRSVADLYRCRWQIEVFFKQIKQPLPLADFLGHKANAMRWQVWTALLTYVLLRYLRYISKWTHSSTRLFTILRAALWQKFDLLDLLARYGTAGGHFRHLARPDQVYFPGS